MSKTKYTAGYFIEKFTAIPDSQWTTGTLENSIGQRCVLGHCGVNKFAQNNTPEERALRELFGLLSVSPARVNDRPYKQFNQPTPKARILAALEYLKSV